MDALRKKRRGIQEEGQENGKPSEIIAIEESPETQKEAEIISEILNNALSEKEISAKEGLELYKTKGMDFHLVGLVADELRKRRVGNIVSYVVNRNINFTNVCTFYSNRQRGRSV